MSTKTVGQLDRCLELAYADHQNAVGKVHLCSFLVGYVGDSDHQMEVFLYPPAKVIVDSNDDGIDHVVDDHLDPYWDLNHVLNPDSRIAYLRSMYSYGQSYNLTTGEKSGKLDVWLAPESLLTQLLNRIKSWFSTPT